MRRSLWLLSMFACLLLSGPVPAVIETYTFSDPALEARYRQLSEELRCPKCQNQNIADSNAPISQDLRRQLHQQLEAGASDAEILEYMVSRYGEFVRYRPDFNPATALLWLAPVLMLALGILVLLVMLRGRHKVTSPPLDEDEQRRLATLMHGAEKES